MSLKIDRSMERDGEGERLEKGTMERKREGRKQDDDTFREEWRRGITKIERIRETDDRQRRL